MFETIAIKRQINESDLKTSFQFKKPDLDLYDIKQGREIVKLYKEYRKECFLNGYRVSAILQDATDNLDLELTKIWEHFLGSKYDYLALVAVGGYGRKEQFLESDIDLLIVSSKDPIEDCAREDIETFVSFLWDLKIDLGTSVRTIKETVLASREDLTIITNLLETHFIAGAKDTYEELTTVLENDDFWDDEKFFEAKIDEQNKRYHSF